MRTAGQIESQRKATKVRTTKGHHRSAVATGHVTADESFSVQAFIDRIGTTRSGLSEMRRRGLKARRDGEKRVMILGSDYIEYLKSQPVAELDAAG